MSLVRAEALMHKSGTILTRAVVHPGHMTLTFGLIHQLKAMILPKHPELEELNLQVTTVLSTKCT